MDTLQEGEALRNLRLREDGTIDINEMMSRVPKRMVNQIMDWQADELCSQDNHRNGYRKRRLVSVLGEMTIRIPKLREGTYFPTSRSGPTRASTGRWSTWSERSTLRAVDPERFKRPRTRSSSRA